MCARQSCKNFLLIFLVEAQKKEQILSMNLIECEAKREQVIKKFLIVVFIFLLVQLPCTLFADRFASIAMPRKNRKFRSRRESENKEINFLKDRDLSSTCYTLNWWRAMLCDGDVVFGDNF